MIVILAAVFDDKYRQAISADHWIIQLTASHYTCNKPLPGYRICHYPRD